MKMNYTNFKKLNRHFSKIRFEIESLINKLKNLFKEEILTSYFKWR